MDNKITNFMLNSLYGKMSPKYEIGYHFKDSGDNEYEILQRQLIGGIIVYAIIGTKTGFINILTEASIDFIVGGARRCGEMSKYKLDKSAQVVENTNYTMTQEEVCERLNDLEAKLAESEKRFVVANNLRKNSDEVLLNYKTEKYGLDKNIEELRKMKLSLPEKEWYYKGFENCERQMSSHITDLTLEVKQLKQQLYDLPKKIVKEIINNAVLQSFDYGERYCEEEASNDWAIDLEDLKEILDTILKKFGGEK